MAAARSGSGLKKLVSTGGTSGCRDDAADGGSGVNEDVKERLRGVDVCGPREPVSTGGTVDEANVSVPCVVVIVGGGMEGRPDPLLAAGGGTERGRG